MPEGGGLDQRIGVALLADSDASPSLGRALLRRPAVVLGLAVIGLTVAAAIAAPVLATHDPNAQMFDGLTLEGAPLPPGGAYLLGTDLLGRDLLSRLLYGARTSLVIGIVANGVAVRHRRAGRRDGRLLPRLDRDGPDALHRPDDGLPGAASRHRAGGDLPAEPVDRRAGHRAGELGAGGAGPLHRDLGARRSGTSSRRNARSARRAGASSGATSCRTCCRRSSSGATLGISTTVLLEATLSFLGIGVQPPTASWGNIIYENQTYFQTAPWLVFFPGALHPRCWRSPSTSSATRCATCSTRRRRGGADGLPRAAADGGGADPARHQLRHLPAALPPARRSGAADRRAQRQRGDGGEHPRAARARPAVPRPVRPLPLRPRCTATSGAPTSSARRCRELIASRLPASLAADGGGHRRRARARADHGHRRGAAARRGRSTRR